MYRTGTAPFGILLPWNKDKGKYISTLDEKRLGELTMKNPEGYWTYAEELARKREDPEVRKDPELRDTVKLLYLIAASGIKRGSMIKVLLSSCPLERSGC